MNATFAVEVAVVDDHAMYRDGAARWIEMETGGVIDVVAAHATVVDLLREGSVPQVVVLDLHLSDGSDPIGNVDVLTRFGAGVVAHACDEPVATIRSVLAAGALAVVRKSAPLTDLLAALYAVARGELFLDPSLAYLLLAPAPAKPVLSSREIEVLRGIAAGRTRVQVARTLGIGEATVKTYLNRIRGKYHQCGRPIRTQLELYQRGVQDGWVTPCQVR
jgi:two-component system nitrate/nitrite response regulator NarL